MASDLPPIPWADGDTLYGADLDAAFVQASDDINAVDSALEVSNDVLHGPGREAAGCRLSMGSGLACVIGSDATVDYYWAGGVRCHLATPVNVSLSPNATTYLYQDATGAVTQFSSLQTPRPAGTWYVGNATTGGDSCTAVDDSGADTVAGYGVLAPEVAAQGAAIGMPYTAGLAIAPRLDTLEAGGGGGSGPVYADGLSRSAGNPTTVGQEFGALEGRLTTVEGEVGSLGGTGTTVVQPAPWNTDSVNQAQALLARIANGPLDEGLAEAYSQVDCLIFVPGVFGDGTGTTPQYKDTVHSDW
jgi:hypothetical protein